MRSEIHKQSNQSHRAAWLSFGAVISAIGASVCCVGPWLLLSLGIGGAWMSTLTSMQVVRPVFIVLTLAFLVLAFRKIYFGATTCNVDRECSSGNVTHRHRIIFWLLSAMVLALLLFPEVAPYFLE